VATTGLFITFEGGEGSGKSTQLARIAARLRGRGIEPVLTREPGGTPLAEEIRTRLLEGKDLAPQVEADMIIEARADLFEKVIGPELGAGRVVLCDRHVDSTLAYQGYGRGLAIEDLRQLNARATRQRAPDLTLLFDLDVRTGLTRRAAAGKGNRIDREPPEFHERVRRGFLELARHEPQRIVVIDAAADADEVESRAWRVLEPAILGRSRTSGPTSVL
jgi:dTMP kinase